MCCSGRRRDGLWRTRSTRTGTPATSTCAACPGAGSTARICDGGTRGSTVRNRSMTSGDEMTTERALRDR
jgi:hypothetical protein